MKNGKIHVLPVGGLCNRLRVIKSTRALARDSKRQAIVWWVVNSQMNARFADLFEYDDGMGFSLKEGGFSSFMARYAFSRYNPKWCDWQDTDKFVKEVVCGGKLSYLSTFSDFYKINGGGV